MPYICEIDADFEPSVFTTRGGGVVHAVDFPIGYETDLNEVALMAVMLVPGASHIRVPNNRVYDLKFGIRWQHGEYEHRVGAIDFTHETSRALILPEYRPLAMNCILSSVRSLISEVEPEHVTMATYEEGIPEKGLRKYLLICDTICEAGFEVAEYYLHEDDGKYYWYLRKTIADGESPR